MSVRRVVAQGESLPQIAAEHGLSPEAVWSAPENRELAALRRNYNVLAPGDVLVIPDKRGKSYDVAVDRRHVFRRNGVPAQLRLQLYDGEAPRAGLEYELVCGEQVFHGTTDADGVLTHWVATGLRRALLRVTGSPEVEIRIGHLDPIDTLSGAQKRLANLGYGCPLSGRYDAATAEALRRFQRRHGLDDSGTLDPATLAELERLHDTTAHPKPPCA
ncbi:peptidoglycan-binding domain-containing protein [Nannocystis punicea]|uniref:Peptidoglycan-binding domain-containing protein n=1 Tax=Nannocystis punicea TaxID=2995304 RepID=A0ABY7HIW1_9BACT|nr:peptidoglycan-binding protein [Nannocystis poenicansa]WAS99281.1 peptidoglycan-binding domain-containing protein [Nannocystis poenicansa]